MKKAALLTLLSTMVMSQMTFAKSSYEKEYEQSKKFRLGSFTIEMVDQMDATKKFTDNGFNLSYYDSKTLKQLPFSRGFYPEMTVIVDEDKTMAVYTANFENQAECINRIGQRELSPLYYKAYKSHAVKRSPDDKVWVTYVDRKIKKLEEINQSDYQLVTDASFAKGYYNPLYPTSTGTFAEPENGDIYFEMECKGNGQMHLMFKDVKRNEEVKTAK